jgi:hypothetical protein
VGVGDGDSVGAGVRGVATGVPVAGAAVGATVGFGVGRGVGFGLAVGVGVAVGGNVGDGEQKMSVQGVGAGVGDAAKAGPASKASVNATAKTPMNTRRI